MGEREGPADFLFGSGTVNERDWANRLGLRRTVKLIGWLGRASHKSHVVGYD